MVLITILLGFLIIIWSLAVFCIKYTKNKVFVGKKRVLLSETLIVFLNFNAFIANF